MPRRGRLWKDHPRVCGEHPAAADASAGTGGGSSPRMRGARTAIFGRPTSGRIIPAYAGSTYLHCDDVVVVQDHPRVCGEHEIFGYDGSGTVGSSPRMRGAHRHHRKD